jgi:hypothetical protein
MKLEASLLMEETGYRDHVILTEGKDLVPFPRDPGGQVESRRFAFTFGSE